VITGDSKSTLEVLTRTICVVAVVESKAGFVGIELTESVYTPYELTFGVHVHIEVLTPLVKLVVTDSHPDTVVPFTLNVILPACDAVATNTVACPLTTALKLFFTATVAEDVSARWALIV
jgi:hypothetical protein